MPEQFVIPQFIDNEDTIFGPVTARQFVILIVVFLADFTAFKLMPFVPFLIVGIPLLIFGGILAFVRINGQPFHFFILNILQTLKKPRLRVWDKTVSTSLLREYMKQEIPPPPTTFVRKAYAGTSRLEEISLVVNTGGIYKPEES